MVPIGIRNAAAALLPGDILHVRTETTLLAKLILWFTRPSWANHTAGVLGIDEQTVTICEAGEKGTVTALIDRLADSEKYEVVCLRWTGVTADQRRIICQSWANGLGIKYPVADLLLHALDRLLFKGKFICRRLSVWDAKVCTAYIMAGYAEAGLGTVYQIDEINPDNLLDWQVKQGHPVVWASSAKALQSFSTFYGGRNK